MIVDLPGKGSWIVQFRKNRKIWNGKQCIDTLGELFRLDRNGRKLYSHSAWAHQHPKDQYDKITGKKIALKRLLEASPSITKQERALFWSAFKREFKV